MAEKPNKPNLPPPPPPPTGGSSDPAAMPPEKKAGVPAGGFGGLRVSLMPRDLEGEGGPDLKLRLLITVLVIIIETGAILGAQFYLTKQIADRQAERETMKQQLDMVAKEAAAQEKSVEDALIFGRQLKAVKQHLDAHTYPTQIIEFLDDNTYPDIKYDRVQVDMLAGVVGLDIVSQADDRPYRRLAEQIVRFAELDDVLQVRTATVSARTDTSGKLEGVVTALVLKIKPTVWQRQLPAKSDSQL